MDIIVTSTKDVKVSAVRQAFQEVFGRANVQGMVSYMFSFPLFCFTGVWLKCNQKTLTH